jgi:isoleucyl-tRNA synthetase
VADAQRAAVLQAKADELEEFFILSELNIVAGPETRARIVRTSHQKCSRCWRFRSTVGRHAAHPELCERCAEVLG